MSSQDILDRLRQLDAYPKTIDDFRVQTFGGAAVTILSAFLMTILFCAELAEYLSPSVTEELFVDTSRGSKLRINLDFVLPSISCEFLVLDAMDTTGEQHLQIDHNVFKRRLDLALVPIEEPKKEDIGATTVRLAANATAAPVCGSCYGAESPALKCCDTCEQVREAYRAKKWAFPGDLESVAQCKSERYAHKLAAAFTEACQIYGYIEVNRVGGSFHIAPGQSFSINHVHVHDVQPFSSSAFNTTHHVRHLSFGGDIAGVTNPIDGTVVVAREGAMMFQYYVKIVPTTYIRLDGQVLQTNQFSITRHQKSVSANTGESGMPGVFFSYELAPMMVKYTEKTRSFGHFATNVCAIIGGVFTVAGLIDSLLYHSLRALQRKIEIGKVN